jgi:hypothetical protein
MATTYNLIASTVLSSSGTVTFSSIPQTYTDLVLKISSRTSRTNVVDVVCVRPDSNTSSVYSYTYVEGNGGGGFSGSASLGTAGAQTEFRSGPTSGGSATADIFGYSEIYIPNYTSSNKKPISSTSFMEDDASTAYLQVYANLTQSTSAITSLLIFGLNNNFVSGSSFYLYGIKNS